MVTINDQDEIGLIADHLDTIAPGEIFLEDDWEINLQYLLSHGTLYVPKRVMWVEGRRSWCHENSCRYWLKHQDTVSIVTGYGYDTGKWFRHSWLTNPQRGNVIETSHRFEKYFGYILSEGEAQDFALENDVY